MSVLIDVLVSALVSFFVGGTAGIAMVRAGIQAGRFNVLTGPSSDDAKAICSCNHGYGMHGIGGPCSEKVERTTYHPVSGTPRGRHWEQCSCQAYDGPLPPSMRAISR